MKMQRPEGMPLLRRARLRPIIRVRRFGRAFQALINELRGTVQSRERSILTMILQFAKLMEGSIERSLKAGLVAGKLTKASASLASASRAHPTSTSSQSLSLAGGDCSQAQ